MVVVFVVLGDAAAKAVDHHEGRGGVRGGRVRFKLDSVDVCVGPHLYVEVSEL